MLAERLSGLLPPLTHDEMLRVASIASVAGEPRAAQPTLTPPFRAPHHTTSAQALVGGGTRPRPGEISLAHRGVLFLDELPEFSRGALEALREPLESGVARISRVHEQLAFPAEFMLVGRDESLLLRVLGRRHGPLQMHAVQARAVPRAASPGRCSTGSTCTSRCRACRSPTSRSRRSATSRRCCATTVVAARRVQLERGGRLNARLDTRARVARRQARRGAARAAEARRRALAASVPEARCAC